MFGDKSGKEVVYSVLKVVEEASPSVSLPEPKNLILNVQQAVSSTKPKEPAKHDIDFDLDTSAIAPDYLQAEVRVGTPQATRSRILNFSTLQLLILLHLLLLWAMNGTYDIVKRPFSVLYTIHGYLVKQKKAQLQETSYFTVYTDESLHNRVLSSGF